MKTDSPNSGVGLKGVVIKRAMRCWQRLSVLLFAATLSAVNGAELLQNGGFSAGLDHWSLPPPLVKQGWEALSTEAVSLDPPGGMSGYVDDVIYQPLNVSGAGGKTVTAGLKLRRVYGDAGMKTIAVFLEYVTTGNTVGRVLAFEVANETVTDVADGWTPVQADVVLPADARKLTKFVIAKQTWGNFLADDAFLTAADLAAGNVPRITAVTGSGQYGAVLTVTGTNLGATAGTLEVNGSTNWVTTQTWEDTEVTALIAEPAEAGVVRVRQDFTESWGGGIYHVTSPTYTLAVQGEGPMVVRGTRAKFVVQADFLNGFASAGGVSFAVPQAPPGVATFSPVPLKESGGVVLTIDTTTLTPGVHEWTVQATEATSVPRAAAFTLDVRQVASVTFRHGGGPVASLNVGSQGELFVGFELRDAGGALLPNQGCQLTSTNPLALLALTTTSNGSFRVFAQDEGNAELRVSAPDGFMAALPVTIAGLPAERMTQVGFTNPAPNNSGTSSTVFSAGAPVAVTGWGVEGMIETEPTIADAFENVDLGATFIQSEPFSIVEGLMPNVFLFYASSAGGTRHAPLTVVNAPGLGSVSGRVSMLGGMGPHGAEGTLEFFAVDDDSMPLLTREVSNWQSPEFTTGAIPPGTYKVRLVSGFSGVTQWYPNAREFEDAQALTFTAGQTVANVDFFPPPMELRVTSQPLDQTVAVGADASFSVVADGSWGPFSYRWQEDGVDLVEGAKYTGTDSPTLMVSGAQLTDSGARYSVVVTDSGSGRVMSRAALLTVGDFDPPVVTTLPSTHPQAQVRALRAVVAGEVNANGAPAMVEVQWGTKAGVLDRTAVGTPQFVTGSSAVVVTASLPGLTGNTTYYYRFVAENSAGPGQGAVQSFTTPAPTPPVVNTLAAGTPTHEAVTLNGTVDPRGLQREVVFDYGPTNAFGSKVAANPTVVPPGGVQSVTGQLTGLLPHTKYFYRAHAFSDEGEAVGATLSFTTANRPVTAQPDSFAMLPSGRAVLPVLDNDMDPDGDTLIIESFTQTPASVGMVSRQGTDLVFTPSASFSGGSFSYRVKDGFGSSSTATVTLTRAACEISPATQSLPANGGSYEVDVTTPAAWRVVESLSWVSATPQGEGNGEATLTVAPNTVLTPRTGTVVIGGEAHTITQAGVLAPQISVPAVIPQGIVSGSYELEIPTINPPVIYTVTGLPPGLKMNAAERKIQGKPLRAGDYHVFIKAKNRAGLTDQIDFHIVVNDLPAYAKGPFTALINRSAGVNDNLGGVTSFSTTATGAVSGTVRLGAATYRLKGQLEVPLSGSPVLDVVVQRRGLPAVLLNLEFSDSAEGPVVDGTASVLLPGGDSATASGALNPWKAAGNAFPLAAVYNLALGPEDPADDTVPQGYGNLRVTALTSGRVNWSGTLADGTTVSGSAAAWQDGSWALHSPLYKGRGSLLGSPQLEAASDPTDPDSLKDVSGKVSWLKHPHTTRTYAGGFGPVTLDVAGSQYVRPRPGQIVMGLPNVDPTDTNALLEFDGAGIPDTAFGTSLTQQFRISTAHRASFSTDVLVNPAKIRITSLNPATGQFYGVLTLVDENPNRNNAEEKRTVKFQGLILLDALEGKGFFLMSELSVPPLTPATMPQRSGSVTLF